MSETRHTPGPWIVRPSIKGPYVAPAPLGLESAICKVLKIATGTGRLLDREQERDANANLIAVAPDLLAALESAPEPTADQRDGVRDSRAERDYFRWYDGPRAAALAKVKP